MHVVILGNGIAGITTARELRKRRSDVRITVVSGESDHHFSRPALMYVFMGHMTYAHTKPYEDRFWAKNRIDLVRAWVKRVDVAKKRLELDRGAPIEWDKLVVATGSKHNLFGWKGQELAGVQGLVTLQDLELLEANARGVRRAVIVGGGLIGVELAEMLHSRGIAVTFLVREKAYWNRILPDGESAMVSRVIRAEGIDLRLGEELDHVVDDGRGRACAVVTKKGERIECQLVGLTAGVTPNLSALEGSDVPVNRGVLVDATLATRVRDVYAAGDCAEIVDAPNGTKGKLEQLWYTGRMQGETLARVLCGESARHDRGVWFNSAKFFDLEYQTYGLVQQELEGEKSLYWEARDGLHALRVVYTQDGVVGMNVLGIRHRHRAWERWIAEKRPVEHVLRNLREANFDPEFARRYEAEMVRAWKEQVA